MILDIYKERCTTAIMKLKINEQMIIFNKFAVDGSNRLKSFT